MKTSDNLANAEHYYDRFSLVYDVLSPDWYYRKPRKFAIEVLQLKEGQTILNLPVGTGQNLNYFQHYLKDSGKIIGIDLSEGMLSKARRKVAEGDWSNVELIKASATVVNADWIEARYGTPLRFDAILCDLGLSGFPEWQSVIDNLLSLLRPGGTIAVMDWYIDKPGIRAELIKWIGGGEVDRPLYQYLAKRVTDFKVECSFKDGDVFVAWGKKSR